MPIIRQKTAFSQDLFRLRVWRKRPGLFPKGLHVHFQIGKRAWARYPNSKKQLAKMRREQS